MTDDTTQTETQQTAAQGTDSTTTTSAQTATQGRTFTQADLDRVVIERLSRERKQQEEARKSAEAKAKTEAEQRARLPTGLMIRPRPRRSDWSGGSLDRG
ncbi:hypothetical protein SAMN04488058_1389 [Deinococcus reticulitermitis]|uniref:Uncharacterized protein n=1 Tax=Deinococcus reticulitermitis TaxID=856736 RepID=A0A1H7CTA7_9DEIO|nr:hypothetical protein [Deinococcus reticulitermitis]SEJ92444.1 hypothetical protein SAMN04488058_1389 [Deinococcus reticulitermitis]